MKDFLELAAVRYSVREFTDAPVKKEDMDRILRAGWLAPTACNRQPQRILVMDSASAMEKLRRCTPCHFDAPGAILICYDSKLCWRRSFDGKTSGDIDAAIVTSHMMLAAADIGVGTTWVMFFQPDAVREEFALPDNLEPVALLMCGYPAPDAKPYPGHSEFRPDTDIVSYNGL